MHVDRVNGIFHQSTPEQELTGFPRHVSTRDVAFRIQLMKRYHQLEDHIFRIDAAVSEGDISALEELRPEDVEDLLIARNAIQQCLATRVLDIDVEAWDMWADEQFKKHEAPDS